MEKKIEGTGVSKSKAGSARSIAQSLEEKEANDLDVGVCEIHQRPFEAICDQCKMYIKVCKYVCLD